MSRKTILNLGSILKSLSLWAVLKTVSKLKCLPVGSLLILGLNFFIFFGGYDFRFAISAPEWLDLLLYQFSHASLNHLMGNMFLLNFVIWPLEAKYGSFRLVFFYVLIGAVSALAWGTYEPYGDIVGASASVCGLVAMFPFLKRSWISVLMSGLIVGSYFYSEFFNSIAYAGAQTAHLAHVAGGVCGLVLSAYYRK